MSRLEIAIASAGAGKTFDLCETVFRAIRDGVDPSRILATTFTKKAAAELKGRLQARILEGGGGDGAVSMHQAERLDFAVIGTVHGVALQLVRKFARHLGLSPRLEVLPEGSEWENLQAICGGFDSGSWKKLVPLMDRLDVREEHLRETLFRLVELKRSSRLNEEEFRGQMKACRARLCELLGPVTEATGQVGAIRDALGAVLPQLVGLPNDTTRETRNALEKIRDITGKGAAQWSDFPKAANLRAGKRSGADQLLETARGMGRGARGYKALHSDVGKFYCLVTEMALVLDREYARFKRDNCQADYTDLLFHLLELLEKPEMEPILLGEFDLVLVDEVQDSQPVEYAIFERLRHLSPRSRWVGDPNQAIYSFKGADPSLLDKYTADESVTTSLDADVNRRSQAGLVQFFGKVFAERLDDRVVQGHSNPPEDRGIERWLLDSTNDASDHGACVRGVLALRDEGFALGDIAILARDNRSVLGLAEAFRECGIATLSASAGLLAQRECALVVAGMRLVADHADTLAAATILHHLSNPDEATPPWAVEWPRHPGRPADIHEIIRELGGNGGDPGKKSGTRASLLADLIGLDARNLSPFMAMVEVIRVLGILEAIGDWTGPCQRAGCIDSLLGLARTHEEESLARGVPATLSGLVLHLEGLARDGADLVHPIPGGNAVHLLTYHKAKGLEWPVVILTDLDKEVKIYPWHPGPAGSGAIDDPLAGRSIRYWQWPFGRNQSMDPQKQFQKGTDLEDEVLREPELVEEKRGLKKEATRLLFVGCTRARRKLVLAHRRDSAPSGGGPAQSRHRWLDDLPKIAEILDKNLEHGREHDLRGHGIETTYIIRGLSPDPGIQAPGETRWLASSPIRPIAGSEVPRHHGPSQAPPAKGGLRATVESLGGRPVFPASMEEGDLPILGQAVHAFLGAIPSLADLDDSIWCKRANDCRAAFGVGAFITTGELVQKAKVFRDWVRERHPGATWHVEVPLSGPRAGGGQWNGAADLVLELPGGGLVLVDHKSSPIRAEHCEARALGYSGQVNAYRGMLEGLGQEIRGAFVHFPLACAIVRLH